MDAKFIKNESGSTHKETVSPHLLAYAGSGGGGLLPQFLPRGPQDKLVGPGQRGLRALCSPGLQVFIIPMPVRESVPPLEKEASRNHGVVSRLEKLCPSFPE